MLVSCITITAREEPLFKEAADAIELNLNTVHDKLGFTRDQFEWIVIDRGLWGKHNSARQRKLQDAVNGRFFFTHEPPKPCAWQGSARLTSKDYPAPNNARNTGLMLVRGERIIFMDDCIAPTMGWLEWHLKGHQKGVAICGAYTSVRAAQMENGRVIDVDTLFHYHDMRDQHRKQELQKCRGNWMYGYNFSVPVSYFDKINGFDEIFNGELGCDDIDAGIRLERAGLEFVYIPQCLVYQILTTHNNPFPDHKNKEKVLTQDGRNHFSNEWLMEALHWDSGRYWTIGNYFCLREARQDMRTGMGIPPMRHTGFDWRDGQALKDM